ncbi:hypothetical protein SARC_03324 [Sphaeroforma arctica JP610]|uniref:Uncharacterized protein n=1 Tax=Sphaeroforma arctica JP610 TaxID=667725 RepID=A0A0L0G605_9EUKA|nr:hypothetical protein SARC_03324 [Sphaeroforma arctica JP610]KNC84460.1 hypothetical protein SARC_03324 [Sphaeroforma arctica JP610]|eukprot:XP_014158362.1 hypothetical protein SARC_03324 [Sphaeroforma arctica JP610]
MVAGANKGCIPDSKQSTAVDPFSCTVETEAICGGAFGVSFPDTQTTTAASSGYTDNTKKPSVSEHNTLPIHTAAQDNTDVDVHPLYTSVCEHTAHPNAHESADNNPMTGRVASNSAITWPSLRAAQARGQEEARANDPSHENTPTRANGDTQGSARGREQTVVSRWVDDATHSTATVSEKAIREATAQGRATTPQHAVREGTGSSGCVGASGVRGGQAADMGHAANWHGGGSVNAQSHTAAWDSRLPTDGVQGTAQRVVQAEEEGWSFFLGEGASMAGSGVCDEGCLKSDGDGISPQWVEQQLSQTEEGVLKSDGDGISPPWVEQQIPQMHMATHRWSIETPEEIAQREAYLKHLETKLRIMREKAAHTTPAALAAERETHKHIISRSDPVAELIARDQEELWASTSAEYDSDYAHDLGSDLQGPWGISTRHSNGEQVAKHTSSVTPTHAQGAAEEARGHAQSIAGDESTDTQDAERDRVSDGSDSDEAHERIDTVHKHRGTTNGNVGLLCAEEIAPLLADPPPPEDPF